jgi:peptidoglycan/xylan/chitin deacetylase (PgdA/CDA1 family)
MRGILFALLLTAWQGAIAGQGPAPPYRFLLVIGDQWEDGASYLIERSGEFQILAGLLKTWGLPFDVLRLDQQQMDRYHLLDRDGRPLYGAILWDAPAEQLRGRNFGILKELKQQGVALVALGDTVAAPEIAQLAGLRYVSEYKSNDGPTFDTAHFITRALAGREKEMVSAGDYSLGGSKVIPEDAAVIGRRGAAPFLTVRQAPGGGRVAWLGIDRSPARLQNQLTRDLLKRCLVWAQGYAAYAEYDHALILFMDDPGTPDKTFLPYWHYRTPSEEEIRRGMIEPLKRHGTMDVNVVTGYVDRKTKRILNPWKQRVIDEIDGKTIHDFASTKRGLDAGVAADVFNIQSHGWTHMLPELDSPPGPFWDAPMDGVGSLDWYNEFGDDLRKREVPAITQRLHMQRSIECIREDFGVTPLVVRPGGGLYSRNNSANNTAVNAARMGFGIATWNWAEYLGPDLVVSLESVSRRGSWQYDRRVTAADIPWTVDAPFWLGFHDRDLSLDNQSFERLLSDLGNSIRFMNGSEYSAYLHAKVHRAASDSLQLAVDYDGHYCRYFQSRPSRWIVHLSDDTRRALKRQAPEKQVVEVPAGLGSHILWGETENAKTGLRR